ncbi:MAG TPA: hypothetical protein VNM15_04925 [Candidatus Binatia bacterium]|nr:hypothetical protein [Candidatus Binatia bacterium]
MRFLTQEEHRPMCDLIFGPLDQPDQEHMRQLKELWYDLRDDILAARDRYRPGAPIWGSRFEN